jgi:glycosyltransferase involved in cell wall biosynthesis
MRILAMTNLYPNPFQPHRATFNRNRLRILGERCAVRVIAPISWTDEFRSRRNGMTALPEGRRLTFDGLTIDHPRYYFPPRIGRSWYGPFYLASVKATFRRVIREFQPDLVYTPWAYPDGWAAVRLGHRAGLKVVLQVLGSDILLLDRFPARRRRTMEAVRSADGIVAVSRDLAETLVRMGVEPEKIRTIYDGVDHKLFHPGDKAQERAILNLSREEKVILFVGNLVPVKAVDVLIRASAELMQEDKRIRLVIVGQGPLRAELDRLARELGIVDRVRFAGSLPHADLPRWFRAADVFVLPSHSEGVPNVLLEASASGVPWVASRVGGIPEIVHLGISRLVTPNAPSELARAIHETLAAPRKELPTGPRSREEAISDYMAFLNERLRLGRSQGEVIPECVPK